MLRPNLTINVSEKEPSQFIISAGIAPLLAESYHIPPRKEVVPLVEGLTIKRLCFPGEGASVNVKQNTIRGDLDQLQGDLVFSRLLHDDASPDLSPIEWRCDHLRQWYAVYPHELPGLGAGYLIDLQTPLVRVGGSYECYDLVMNLFVDAQERYHLLHEEEYTLAKECGWLHHRMAEKTWLQVADWVTLIKSGGFNHWLVELRRKNVKR